jgi:ATP-binding protein involved in chromosome partitioning
VVSDPDGAVAAIYRDIARRVWDQMTGTPQRAAPAIVFE